MVAAAFGLKTRDLAKSDILLSLEALLASHAHQGKRCLLIVDEAQNLTQRAVEELRMLSNFQLGTHALLQTFLVGQPEFRHILQSPEMNQLRQRVIAACHIGPLDVEDTQKYIEHRLRRVGWKNVPLFMPGTFQAIFAASGGVPRRINLLCDRILLSGFLTDKRTFSAAIVKEVADEINGETVLPGSLTRRISDLDPDPFATAPPSSVVEVEFAPRKSAGGAPQRSLKVLPQAEGEALEHVENAMKELETKISRIERGNQATLKLFRRFLDWARTQETDRATPK